MNMECYIEFREIGQIWKGHQVLKARNSCAINDVFVLINLRISF